MLKIIEGTINTIKQDRIKWKNLFTKLITVNISKELGLINSLKFHKYIGK